MLKDQHSVIERKKQILNILRLSKANTVRENTMLNMIKGCKISHPERLKSQYELATDNITANVDADKIDEILQHFISMKDEPLFFILELPSNAADEDEIRPGVVENLHKDVYYIDGCDKEKVLTILKGEADILINDGLCCFGFGGHESGDEIMSNQYNIMTIYSKNIEKYSGFFEQHNITKTKRLTTAWDTFTKDSPGECELYEKEEKNVYSILEDFKDLGIYLAERKEDL
mgnify:FL=1